MKRAPETYSITALKRGLRLLAIVGSRTEAVSAQELAVAAGLHASTVHRFLVNLESEGFLTHDSHAGGYRLGPMCVMLGRSALESLDVRRASLPILREINRETRETVHLTVRHDLRAVYVEKFDSLEPLRIFSQVGRSVPLYCSGVGKVLLAFSPEAERAALLARIELKRLTPRTLTSLPKLEAELDQVRRQGYALDLEENEKQIRCIAAPIWDHSGRAVAAFSITGPATRMPKTRLMQLAPTVIEAGQRISAALGYNAVPASNGRALYAAVSLA